MFAVTVLNFALLQRISDALLNLSRARWIKVFNCLVFLTLNILFVCIILLIKFVAINFNSPFNVFPFVIMLVYIHTNIQTNTRPLDDLSKKWVAWRYREFFLERNINKPIISKYDNI